MSIEEEIEDLLDCAQSEERGARQYELTKKALQLANKTKDENIIFEVKIAHIESTTFYGKHDEALLNFVWCRNIFLKNMEEYSEFKHSLLWDYKWIINNLIENPQVSLEKLNEVLEDFADLSNKLNYSKRTARYLKFNFLKNVLNISEAAKFIDWQKIKRDSLSDCNACELDSLIDFYIDTNKYSLAKKKFNGLIKSQMSCISVPLTSYAYFLSYLIEEKDFETAEKYYEKCHKDIMKNPDFLNSQGLILIYLVAINDLSKALKWFEKQFTMTTIVSSIKDKMYFYIASELLFKKIKKEKAKKTITLKLKKNDVLSNNDNTWDINELISFFESKNIKTVASFNARNCNTGYTVIYERFKKLTGV